jgi:histidine phosphotransferase ChpT
MRIEVAILEFACSRLCHDLVSPIGAVNNGLELLEDEKDPGMAAEARALAVRSAKRASILLQVYRCAFGNAGNQAGFGLKEAFKLGQDYLQGGRVTLSAEIPANVPELPAGFGKLVLTTILLMAETMPRTGSLTFAMEKEGGFSLTAEAPQFAGVEDFARLIQPRLVSAGVDAAGADAAGVDARNVLAYLAGLQADRLGLILSLGSVATNRLALQAVR